MRQRYDAIIIGTGIIGSATALELARAGWKTLSIDKNPSPGYGSTSGSCAIIRVHYSTYDGAAFAYEGYFDWKDWAGYLGSGPDETLAKFHETGALVMKTEHNGMLATIIANMQKLGIAYEEWDAARIKQRFPFYDLSRFSPAKALSDPAFGQPTGGEVTGAVYFPTAGYINDPQLATVNIADAARRAGAEFLFNRRVVEIPKTADGRVAGVVLDDGSRIAAPVVVNVAGPHSAKVNAMAGALGDMTITTGALRQEVVHVPAPDGFDVMRDGMVTSDSDISCYARPETGNHILIGSEDPPCDPREFVDPDDYDTAFTDQWTVQAQRMAQRIPTLGIPHRRRGVVDLYDVADDWIPIYDKSCVPGYYMAIGTSGNQFKNAPPAGRAMAELIGACEAGHDHDADPLKVKMLHTGLTLDMGFYSRKREINKESSFSVLG
ncbi:MAG: FAD-binding oxidoreductase [Rhodospirillaceae bacterium]|nr:FAD-binding oxidoreductase [Rhodospirillaceae bacterium]